MKKKRAHKKYKKYSPLLSFALLGLFMMVLLILTYQLKDYLYSTAAPDNFVTRNLKIKPSPKPSLSPLVQIPKQSGPSVNVPILTYHYIGNNPNPKDTLKNALSVSPDKLEQQMEYLSNNGYNTISLDTLYAVLTGKATIPPKPIILTFDDGYIDFYTTVYPILKKYNVHATSFIPTGLVGGSYYMNWDQIKEIDASGLVSFEAHSVNHYSLPLLPNDQLTFQIVQSKKVLEAELGKPINFFAYPYGTSNARVWQAVKEAGFVGGVGTWYGATESEGVIFDMPRIKVSGDWDIKSFASRI